MSQKREIECLTRLQNLTGSVDEILQFILDEKLIEKEKVKDIKHSSDQAKELQIFLKNLSKTDKIQLLEYEWVILPVERIKISVVTNRSSKEFTFNF
jgi:hypothetical protein